MKKTLFMFTVLVSACSIDTPLFDDIAIVLEDFAEYDDEYGRAGRIVLSVENPTVVPVSMAVISLSLTTDGRSYFATVRDERGIPPGMKVYIVVEFVYLSAEERASISGVTFTGSYFA